jgi:glyoxylase-like metal-dependent hydrolase (beta-lactamase superfamily II)
VTLGPHGRGCSRIGRPALTPWAVTRSHIERSPKRAAQLDEAVANWVALHNRNLETISITHAHFDDFHGLSVLLDRFPDARAIAMPKTLSAMQTSFTPLVERLARGCFPGQVATKLVAPEPYQRETAPMPGSIPFTPRISRSTR